MQLIPGISDEFSGSSPALEASGLGSGTCQAGRAVKNSTLNVGVVWVVALPR